MNHTNPPSRLRVTLRVEPQSSGTIAASVIEFPDCRVEAETREAAIAQVQAALLKQLAHIETIPWDVPLPSAHPTQIPFIDEQENSVFADIMNRIQTERDAWGDEEMDASEYTR